MALNPVEQRLVSLCNYWDAFRSDLTKRLLIWQVPDNVLRLLQCFFEVQKHETEYSTGDLFIAFDAPFENSIQYSRALKEALAGQYDASREDLQKQGITPDWRFTPQDFPDSATGFVRSLVSFFSAHQNTVNHLAAVLMPSSVTSDDAFVAWIKRSLDSGFPETLRFVVVDTVESPRLSALTGLKHPLVYVDSPPLDGLTTAQETFAQEPTFGPAGVFRNYLMGLVTLIEKGSAEQVQAKAADALAFARKEQWADQEVVIAMIVAGAFLKEKKFEKAIDGYQKARLSASLTAKTGHPAGQQLILQTWFGEASAHLAAGNAAQAAVCYDQAAIVAQQIPNLILAIEAFRMGVFCHARLNNRDAAIERGSQAMTLGEQLEPDARAMSTLPIAAVDLLRVIEPERVKRMEEIKHRKDMQEDKVRQAAEQRAAELERKGNAQQLHMVEHDLAAATEDAWRIAAQELKAVTDGAGGLFRQIFAKARNLLGEQWPLESPIAMPRAPVPSGASST